MRNLLLVCLLILSVSIYCESQQTGQQILYDSLLNMNTKEAFKMWHYLEKKEYSLNSEVGLSKYRVFKDNVKYIKQRNAELVDFQLGIGPLTDLSFEEYKATLLTKESFQSGNEQLRKLAEINFDQMADDEEEKSNIGAYDWSVDFKDVKDQGTICGSCWAFSTSGAISGAIAKKSGKYTPLSAQYLVDCDSSNKGCSGGRPEKAFEFVRVSGIANEKDYPYTGKVGTCRSGMPLTKINSMRYCSNKRGKSCSSGSDSCSSLLTSAPVVVAMDASSRDYQNYKSGLYTTTCTKETHAVILVHMNNDYNKIRNSWGANWGINGYMHVKKNNGNNFTCYTENECFAPVL